MYADYLRAHVAGRRGADAAARGSAVTMRVGGRERSGGHGLPAPLLTPTAAGGQHDRQASQPGQPGEPGPPPDQPAQPGQAGEPGVPGPQPGQPGEPGASGPQPGELVSRLYQAHALTLVRMARLLLRDQPSAEDVVQDAFLGLYRALPRLCDPEDVLPYLRAAVINRSRSVLRSRQRARLRRVQHEPPASSAESAAMLGEDRRAVLAAVARLPRRAREVLVLRYYLGLSDQEIAAALNVSRGTVSSTASRGLTALARDLKESQ
jgi:RNA polymerase sigma-70 factor (sigma-E family)